LTVNPSPATLCLAQTGKETTMSETTESEIQGATVISVYTCYNATDRYITVTLKLPNGDTLDLEANQDGYGASWIES